MKPGKLIFILVAAMMLAVSCGEGGKDTPVPSEPILKVDPASIDAPAAGLAQTIQLKATRDWKAAADSWIKIDQTSGTANERSQFLNLVIEENEGAERKGSVRFSSGDLTAELTVSQAAAKYQMAGKGEGTLESPFNIARAQAIIAAGEMSADAVYLQGKISEIKEISTSYGNATYYLSDDGTTDNQLMIYRGKGLNGDAFISENALKLGDDVLLLGVLVLYESSDGSKTPEVTSNSKIITLNGAAAGAGDADAAKKDIKAATAPFGWLELPATSSSDGKDYIAHHIAASGAIVRNFSYYWDYENLVAPWVAYPLTGAYIASGSRNDSWGLEPLLDRKQQPVLIKGFKSGCPELDGTNCFYARGHQIPQADRRITALANEQTYYGTNMTPQINKNTGDASATADFNGGIWSNLETQVRDWARADGTDTLYVVTGCDLKDAKYTAEDNDGKKITVPTGYYKALIRYSASQNPHYSGFAVYLEHKPMTRSNIKAEDVMSIKALEEKLGIDFFVNLPAVVGADEAARIESANPLEDKFWGIN